MLMTLMYFLAWLVAVGLAILALVFTSAGLSLLLSHILAGLRRSFGSQQNQKM